MFTHSIIHSIPFIHLIPLSHSFIHSLIHSFHFISFHFLSCPVLSCPFLSFPFLSFPSLPFLSFPFLSFMHTHVHTYIHTYVHTYIHTYIHPSERNLNCPAGDFRTSRRTWIDHASNLKGTSFKQSSRRFRADGGKHCTSCFLV